MTTLKIEGLPRNDDLTVEEMKIISGGWFAFHATTEAMDAMFKALATTAQKG